MLDREERRAVIRQGMEDGGRYLLCAPAALTRGPAGTNLGSGSGSSIDFHDFREYQPGDDLRRVDWSAYARGSGLMLKLFREEISPVAEIILDHSMSMAVSGAKEAAALYLCAFLAGSARRSEGRPVLVIGSQRHVGEAVEAALERVKFQGESGLPQMVPPGASGKPLRFIVSDFLFACDFPALLGRLAQNAAAMRPVMLLSKQEADPEWSGDLRLEDCEDGRNFRELHITPSVVQRYRKRLAKHIDHVSQAARAHQEQLCELVIPDSELGNTRLLQALSQQLVVDGFIAPANL